MFDVDTKNITSVTDILDLEASSLTYPTWIVLLLYNLLVVVIGIGGNLLVLYLSIVHR